MNRPQRLGLSQRSSDAASGALLTGVVLAFALIVRATALWMSDGGLAEDPDSYAQLATTWAESGVYGFSASGTAEDNSVHPTAFRPPLYPWLLSWWVVDGQLSLVGIAWLHGAMGLTSVWLTLSIGQALQLRFAPLAALAVALDPLLLRASQLVMTETVATLLVLIAWRVWLMAVSSNGKTEAAAETAAESAVEPGCSTARFPLRWWMVAGLLGVLGGLSILARPTAAPWALLCVLSLLGVGASCWKRRLASTLIAALGVMVCVVPWTLRNWSLLGKPIWATSHGGYTLYLANNPTLYQHFVNNGPSRAWNTERFDAAWLARPRVVGTAAERELADDRWAYAEAWRTIAEQPLVFGLSCLIRVAWLWALWPHASPSSIATWGIGGWYLIWFAAALWGVVYRWGRRWPSRLRWAQWLPAVWLIVTLSGIHAVYWSNMRMRGPAMPIVYLLAVSSLGVGGGVSRHPATASQANNA